MERGLGKYISIQQEALKLTKDDLKKQYNNKNNKRQ